MVAKVATVKVPASLTESGFVPPELNVNENAEPPLENDPVPNGLVRVTTLLETTQLDDVLAAPLTLVIVQELA